MTDIGNVSTIATWTGIIVMIIEMICKHFGIEIPHESLTMLITAVLTFIIAVWSSKNPNNFGFLGNATPAEEIVGDDDDI